MPRHASFVTLLTLLQRRFPDLDNPAQQIKEGAVLVDGVPAASTRTRVRADASIHVLEKCGLHRCARPASLWIMPFR